ncbi:MAG: hypothetical protein ABFD97_13645 [Syntrophobacter sp.]
MAADELAFFGKIAAGVTHELKNVLAIIRESNGLMADLIALAKDSPFPQRERFLRSVDRIEDQVRRGVDITSRFNRFSHSMDHASANIDLNEIVAQTVALTCRFARLKEIELLGTPSEGPVTLTTSPFRLQMALTKAIEACIESMPGKGTIRVDVPGNPAGPELTIHCETREGSVLDLKEVVTASRPWLELEQLVPDLGIGIGWRQPGAGITLSFSTDEVNEPEQ